MQTSSLGADVGAEFHNNAAGWLSVDGDVKVDLGVEHGCCWVQSIMRRKTAT